MILDLRVFRERIDGWFESLRIPDSPYGDYRAGPGERGDLYASLDIALCRTLMGEDLSRHPRSGEWVEHINSYFDLRGPQDGAYRKGGGPGKDGVVCGCYTDLFTRHSYLHANGMVIGALGALGGHMPWPNRLFDPFDTAEKLLAFLDGVDWGRPWGGSHEFWGGPLFFSFSRRRPEGWLEAAFDWLDREADPETGWWRRGVEPDRPVASLGGFVHIAPLYDHHDHVFPYPDKVIDRLLASCDPQDPARPWGFGSPEEAATRYVGGYLDLDALYALRLMRRDAPEHRTGEIRDLCAAYGRSLAASIEGGGPDRYFRNHASRHPHFILGTVGALGLLNHHLPEEFPDDRAWSDIFSDPRLYRTGAVEVLEDEVQAD